MSRLEGGVHGLKADPSARADDQHFRHDVMLPVGSAWLAVMCDAGSRIARLAGGLKRVSKAVAVALRATWPQNGLAVSRNRPDASNEGTARRLVKIFSWLGVERRDLELGFIEEG